MEITEKKSSRNKEYKNSIGSVDYRDDQGEDSVTNYTVKGDEVDHVRDETLKRTRYHENWIQLLSDDLKNPSEVKKN